jgi:hypothetical protein
MMHNVTKMMKVEVEVELSPENASTDGESTSSHEVIDCKNDVDAATRKSIAKYMTLGSAAAKGSDNPITIHDCDDSLMRAVWSLIAETMVVKGELSRKEKEAVAMVTNKNSQCAVCVTTRIIETPSAYKKSQVKAEKGTGEQAVKEERQRQMITYAEMVTKASRDKSDFILTDGDERCNLLSAMARAEIALVVLIKQHLLRSLGAILGEQMSAVGVSRDAAMEKQSSVMGTMNKVFMPMMKPMMKPFFLAGVLQQYCEPGITDELFKYESDVPSLPSHLQGVQAAGAERAQAVARLNALVGTLYEYRLKGYITKQVMELVDGETAATSDASMSPVLVVKWIERKLESLSDEKDKAVATALLLMAYFPKRLLKGREWKALVKAVGGDEKEARLIVIWYSLRFTLGQARGLDNETMRVSPRA